MDIHRGYLQQGTLLGIFMDCLTRIERKLLHRKIFVMLGKACR